MMPFKFSLLLLLVSVPWLSGCGPLANHYNDLGAQAFGLKDLSAARENFKKAVWFDGGNATFHNNLGYCLYQLKDFNGAEGEFQKALLDSPSESLIRQIKINQVLLYCDGPINRSLASKEWDNKGIGILNELLKEDPNNAEFHMRLGFAYFQAANPGGGFIELDKAVQLATPAVVAGYTQDPLAGSLLILQQIQQFYVGVHFLKKSTEVSDKIAKILRMSKSPPKAAKTRPKLQN